MAEVEAISEVGEEEEEDRIKRLWAPLQKANEIEINNNEKVTNPEAEKLSYVTSSIPTNVPPIRVTLPSEKALKMAETIKYKEKPKNKRKYINLQLENVKLAAKFDESYGIKIIKKTNELQKNLDEQKELVEIKKLLPKDNPTKDNPLPEKVTTKIDALNKEKGFNLDKNNIEDIKEKLESESNYIDLNIKHGFNDILSLNSERTSIYRAAQQTINRDDKDTMVRNQTSR